MHNHKSVISYALIIFASACVDRIDFDIEVKSDFPIVIEGYISDKPGPYTINISNSFDIDSKETRKTQASVEKIIIMDDQGNQEVLSEVEKGVYKTSASGIMGVYGRAYRLQVTLPNSAVFESVPDTLSQPSKLDSVYFEFKNLGLSSIGETDYAFDIYFNGSTQGSNNKYFMWKFTGTFKVETVPEFDNEGEACGNIDCHGCNICNLVWKCSGLRNKGTARVPVFVRYEPCSCCTCWYNIYDDKPILSDLQFLQSGQLKNVMAGRIPVHQWIFQHKVFAEVNQQSISSTAYNFYKSIKDQKDAVNSLFQPITGRVKNNFIGIGV